MARSFCICGTSISELGRSEAVSWTISRRRLTEPDGAKNKAGASRREAPAYDRSADEQVYFIGA